MKIETFKTKVLLLVLVSSLISLILISSALTAINIYNAKQDFQNGMLEKVQIISYNLIPMLIFDDVEGAQQLLASLTTDANVDYAQVLKVADGSAALNPLTEYVKTGVTHRQDSLMKFVQPTFDDEELTLTYPIVFDGEVIGYLHLHARFQQLKTFLYRAIAISALILLLSLGVSMLISFQFQKVILRPLKKLTDTTQSVVRLKDYAIRAPKLRDKEFNRLGDNFNHMLSEIEQQDIRQKATENQIRVLNLELEDKVIERTRALEESNITLKTALENLHQSQIQLVEQEKMASLGQVVAGISHEINTPIGISVTATSHFQDTLAQLRKKLADGTLTATDLNKFLDDFSDCIDIVLRNLSKAAELISSFKQISVDQSADKIRRFNVQEYLQEILTTLKPESKKVAHKIHIDCDDFTLNTNAGALYQIITNLVLNSFRHAFDGIEQGNIYIDVHCENGTVQLCYRDDGNGMSQEHLSKLFDPFFTTKRNQGGSGLGAHLVYNLVNRALNGSIQVISQANEGLSLKIEFPQESLLTGSESEVGLRE